MDHAMNSPKAAAHGGQCCLHGRPVRHVGGQKKHLAARLDDRGFKSGVGSSTAR